MGPTVGSGAVVALAALVPSDPTTIRVEPGVNVIPREYVLVTNLIRYKMRISG